MGRHSVNPRKPRQYRAPQEYDLSPHENLALAIVVQAIVDTRTLLAGGTPKGGGICSPHELLNFFKSQWCGTLLGTTEMQGDEIAKRVGLYELFNSR